MASDGPLREDEWDRFVPMQLQFGDILLMPTFHSVHGADKRGYLFVGMVKAKDGKEYPLFCTLQTSKNNGPRVISEDPTTFCRPEVSIYTHSPEQELPAHTSLEKRYLAGSRGIERSGTTIRATEFTNLCQLAVLYPPPEGILARPWGSELSNDFLKVFKKEFEHLAIEHRSLYMGICEFYRLSNGDDLPRKAGKFKEALAKLIRNAPSRNSTIVVQSEHKCLSKDCSAVQRIHAAVKRCRSWAWGKRGFTRANNEYQEKTGIMQPFDLKAYKLNEITLNEDRESLDLRLKSLHESQETHESPESAPPSQTSSPESSTATTESSTATTESSTATISSSSLMI